MSIDVIAYAAIGGLIPDAIRILKWSRKAKNRRGGNPLRDPATYIAVCIQIALGLFGAALLAVTTPLQATAIGYAAPDILTRILSGAARSQTVKMGAAETPHPSLTERLMAWWSL
jgi:hypothetical protein